MSLAPELCLRNFSFSAGPRNLDFWKSPGGLGGVVVCSSRPSGCPVELGEMQALDTGRLRACVLGVP